MQPPWRGILDVLDTQSAAQTGKLALVVTSADQHVLHANLFARRLLGDAAAAGTPFPLAQRAIPGQTVETVLTDRCGQRRTCELRACAVEWDGEPASVLALHDVTDSRSTELGLVLGRRAMEVSANGILIVDAADPHQPLIYVNPAFERITGYRRGEALGRNCSFLQAGDRDQPELQRLREALARGEDVNVVLRNYRKDGTLFLNDLSISPVRNAAGVVTHFVGIQNDVTERRRHEAEMLRRSTHDELTDLPNRTLLLERMRQALALARDSHGLAVLMIDLDQFKAINDSLGHDTGDRILVQAATRLKACLRETDTLARLIGDEFVAVVAGLDRPESVAAVAQRILEAAARPYLVDGHTIYCSCSIGVTFAENMLESPSLLMQRADLAMHAAKRAGRNMVHFHNGELAQRVSDRLQMRTQLQCAIERGEFELHYQPQLSLHGNRISGVEALLRWRHPELGDIAPAKFIPVAEETGQIVALGEWVMEQACTQHRRWLDRGLLDGPVAVNVSAVQFRRDGFVDTVAAVLARTGLPPQRLELELTESVMMESGGRTLDTLQRLRGLGVSLSIDDFGTGFSSLAYLKRLPIDKLKIDRSFVMDITHDGADAAITLSVIAMAHHLRMRVVAEGVETPAQLAYLRRHLCDEVQGFHIARPLPPAQLEAFLAGFRPPAAGESRRDGGERPTLLLVDDEPNILRALTRTLRRDGYRILTAGSAAEAFQVLAQHEVQVIVSDQRMPNMSGTRLLGEVKSLHPRTIRMVLSGYTDLKSVTEAINQGAIYRFLTKPWEDDTLRTHIKDAFLHHLRGRIGAAAGA